CHQNGEQSVGHNERDFRQVLEAQYQNQGGIQGYLGYGRKQAHEGIEYSCAGPRQLGSQTQRNPKHDGKDQAQEQAVQGYAEVLPEFGGRGQLDHASDNGSGRRQQWGFHQAQSADQLPDYQGGQ